VTGNLGGFVAKNSEELMVASLDPNAMLVGGLKDDFRGVITEAAYVPWDYDGNIEEHVLAVRLTIQPDDDDNPFVQHWSAGSLDAFAPSEDGRTIASNGEGGPYALKVGKKAQLRNNTNWAHLMGAIIDAGEASKLFTRSNLTPSIACLEGIDAHWDRVPQKKRSGLLDDNENARPRDILVVSEIYAYNENSGPTKKVTKAAIVTEETTENESDLDSTIQGVVLEAISEAPGGKLKKSKVVTAVLKGMAKDSNKSKAVRRAAELDFVENGPWDYDTKKGILSLG
jgi:hypothetical protein